MRFENDEEKRTILTRDWFWLAHVERISHVPIRASARSDVVDHTAVGALATRVWARIDALVAVAVLVTGTVCVYHTLGLAGDPWVAEELGETLAVSAVIIVPGAFGVGSAW